MDSCNDGLNSLRDGMLAETLQAANGALLRDVVARLLPGAVPLECRALGGGISAQMAVVRIRRADGQERRIVLRRHAGAAEEYQLLRRLRGLKLPVPRVLGVEMGENSPLAPFLVMEYVDGKMDFSPADPVSYGRVMADALVSIHNIPLAQTGSLHGIHPSDLTGPRVSPPPGDPFGVERIWRALDAAGLAPENTPTLLHGDFWPGNILWNGGKVAAVVDWEDAGMGDPLVDLAIARLDLRWIISREVMEAFTARYLERTSRDLSALPYWDLYAVLRLSRLAGADLEGWARFFVPYDRSDITAESIREHVAEFTAGAIALLEGRRII